MDYTDNVKFINDRFVYRRDKGEKWQIMELSTDGKLYGDCEDYSLTLAFLHCGMSWRRFICALFKREFDLYYCTDKVTRGGHAVMRDRFGWIDNNVKEYVERSEIEKRFRIVKRYRFHRVLIKLLF